jgi:pimeloyl-ACP methyl ester carboxylesterase
MPFSAKEEITFRKILGINTRCFKKGKGQNLVLIPGWRSDIERGYLLLDLLSDYFSVYSLDLPGTGKTDSLKTRHTIDNYALFVNEWIKKLKLNSFILSGISMGCPIAVLSLKDKDNIKKIRSLLFFLPIYNLGCLNLNRIYITIIKATTSILEKWPFYKIGDKFYHSDNLMKIAIRVFEKEKALKKPKNLQYHIDSFKRFSFKVSMETITSLLKTDLSNVPLKSDIPAIIVMARNDPLVKFEKSIEGYKKIFHDLYVEELSVDFHAPRVIITKKMLKKKLGGSLENVQKRLLNAK